MTLIESKNITYKYTIAASRHPLDVLKNTFCQLTTNPCAADPQWASCPQQYHSLLWLFHTEERRLGSTVQLPPCDRVVDQYFALPYHGAVNLWSRWRNCEGPSGTLPRAFAGLPGWEESQVWQVRQKIQQKFVTLRIMVAFDGVWANVSYDWYRVVRVLLVQFLAAASRGLQRRETIAEGDDGAVRADHRSCTHLSLLSLLTLLQIQHAWTILPTSFNYLVDLPVLPVLPEMWAGFFVAQHFAKCCCFAVWWTLSFWVDISQIQTSRGNSQFPRPRTQ